jgi:hypothetical protein
MQTTWVRLPIPNHVRRASANEKQGRFFGVWVFRRDRYLRDLTAKLSGLFFHYPLTVQRQVKQLSEANLRGKFGKMLKTKIA